MVRINLLRTTTSQKSKKGVKTSSKKNYNIIVITIIIALLASGSIWYFISKPVQKTEVVKATREKTDFVPSTHVKPNMIEDVISEVNAERNQRVGGALVNLSYDEMSFSEKITYEVVFTEKVFDRLSSLIPPGVGFKTLQIDNFNTLYAVGIGGTQDLVNQTFANLKADLGLLSQPYSSIAQNGNRGFRFVVTCKPAFGVDYTASFQAIDFLFTKEQLTRKIAQFKEMATQNNLTSKNLPSSITMDKIGEYRRFEYEWKCNGSYKSFVAFVNAMYNEKYPCAFKSIHITANNNVNVSIDTRFIITVKE
jgi:hypothetical protein